MPSHRPEFSAQFEHPGLIEAMIRSTVGKFLSWSLGRKLRRFLDSTNAPHPIQHALLFGLLHKNRNTDFGRDHGFSGIQSLADFRKRIPVAGYDRVEPYMARVRQGDTKALLSDKRIHMFALTSGTTNTRKTIPVNDQYLDTYRAGWSRPTPTIPTPRCGPSFSFPGIGKRKRPPPGSHAGLLPD